MSATLLLHMPASGPASRETEALSRFLIEEGDGLFSRLLVLPDHVGSWRECVAGVTHLPHGDSLLVFSDELAEIAQTIGRALQDTFGNGSVEKLRAALSDTQAGRRSCGLTYASSPGALLADDGSQMHDELQAAVAPAALPAWQRREMIRCMHAILFAASGNPVVAPLQFVGDSQSSEEDAWKATADENTADMLERLAIDFGTPDSDYFAQWNDAVRLLRIRESVPVLNEDASDEHLLDTGPHGIGILRGDPAKRESGLVLALANPSSDVVEVNIDRRALGGELPVTMEDYVSGDTVYVPQAGSHVLSLDLEPYETMWLDLAGESV